MKDDGIESGLHFARREEMKDREDGADEDGDIPQPTSHRAVNAKEN